MSTVGDILSTVGDVQCRGGYLECLGVFSTMGDMMHMEDIMSTAGGGGYWTSPRKVGRYSRISVVISYDTKSKRLINSN